MAGQISTILMRREESQLQEFCVPALRIKLRELKQSLKYHHTQRRVKTQAVLDITTQDRRIEQKIISHFSFHT